MKINSNGIFKLLLVVFFMTNGMDESGTAEAGAKKSNLETATFAGGCFWCMEKPFDLLDGVKSTISGYTSGHKLNPTYKEVSAGITGHTEAIQVVFDPKKISFEKLLEVFWRNIDPTVENRQFCDIGSQYRSGIYFHSTAQQKSAEVSKNKLRKKLPKIYTEVVKATKFYPAEDYHQNYYKKNPIRYKYYRYGCGRDKRLKELWGRQS